MRKKAITSACVISGLAACWLTAIIADTSTADNSEVAWQSRDDAHMINLFTVGGRPVNKNNGHKVKILVNHAYAVGYSEERRSPLWAVYRASEAKGDVDDDGEQIDLLRFERSRFFSADSRVTPAIDGRTFGSVDNVKYDRGHMVPNSAIATQYGSLAQLETFYMTNMCAQAADLNQGPWQRLEKWITQAADKPSGRDHVFVVCGPIFGANPDLIERGPERRIQIPDAFFMILVDTSFEFNTNPSVKLLAYRFPQDTDRDADFKDRNLFGTSVNTIETQTGLDFFPEFGKMIGNWEDKEDAVEMTHWTLD